ncbi:MAG TPA: phosphatase PAP2 family protein [Sphingomonas sp.]|nr:phosphatase PAP2 family protein [Sphingomonas sp.]
MSKAGSIAAGTIADADVEAGQRAAEHRDHPVVKVAGQASEIADQPPLVALSAATVTLGLVLRRPAILRVGLRMLAAHALATGVKSVVKANIDRTRPARAEAVGHHVGSGAGTQDGGLNSFPSGHTAGAVAVTEAIVRDIPGAALPARAAAIAVAGIQVPRGKHYVSDLMAGAAIGWASEVAVNAGLRIAERALGAARAQWRGTERPAPPAQP